MTIKEDILIECAEDYVGLWALAWEFRNADSKRDALEIRQKTIQLIKELLNDNLIKVGNFNVNEERFFEVWELSPTEIIKRIENEWDALGREPSIGEIVWFTAMEKV